jgi:cytochrome P450
MSETARPAERPAHVPPDLVHDFDIFRDAGLLADPHQRVRELITEAPPLFWTPRNGGHWLALRFADAARALREPANFTSAIFTPEQMAAMAARIPPGMPRIPQSVPVQMDPPEHTKYRAPLQKAFSPKTMMALKTDIDVLAASLIEAIAPDGACDFIPAVAEQFPVRVFLQLMGLPQERLPEFRNLVREVFAPRGPDPLEIGLRLRKVADAMLPFIEARRDTPQDDLISLLWSLDIEDEPMTVELVENYAVLLFLAGLDTVINAIGHGMRHLASNPELQAQLRANPKFIPDATEELLRRYTFVIPMRRVTQDLELGGVELKSGDIVQIFCPAGDLDAAEFPDPIRFDLARTNKAHLAFGAGPHRCLGSHLARIELQAIYRVVLDKLPEFRADPNQAPHFHAGNLLAVASLPIRWD